MKNLIYLVAICFTVALIGCESTQTTASVNPGAVSDCGAKQGEKCAKAESDCCKASKCHRDADASMGAVSEGCDKAKTDCQKSGCTKTDANLGAVGEKAPCGSGCKKTEEANLGAVSEGEGCSKAKTGCKKSDANLGAVSEKAPCSAAKSPCGGSI